MALIFAEDIDDLANTKSAVQQIYNSTYRFAKPPDPPTLTAYPGDGKVILTWDEKAERSFDPFLQEFDFEGYKIYRSTEPEFLETREITDAYGRKTFRKPIAQFDLHNGIKGLHPIGVEGVQYNLGEDTGLRHVFIDTEVKNGQTYYYAVVSYDHGFVDTTVVSSGIAIEGITPSESPSTIKQDISGEVQLSINTAMVTPNTPAAGWRQPGLDGDIIHETPGTGTVHVEFLVPDMVSDNASYELVFSDTSQFHLGPTAFMQMFETTGGNRHLLVDTLEVRDYAETPMVNGMVVSAQNNQTVALLPAETGWLTGNSNYKVAVGFDPRFSSETNPTFNINLPIPADYEIRFSDELIGESQSKLGFPKTPTKFQVWNLTEDEPAPFLFSDVIKDETLTPDTSESILLYVDNPQNPLKLNTTWRIIFETDPLQQEHRAPLAGDVYRITTSKPFRNGDTFAFTVQGKSFDRQQARTDLASIYVVPNPYRVAASWEPRNPFRFGRGERRLFFNNLPKDCTIRIYTLRGHLVDTIAHHGSAENSAASWNRGSKAGPAIAYGL